jgi:hypothetical protein
MGVNEPAARASDPSMDPNPPSRVDLLLMRAFDGEADAAERAELSAWAEAEPRLAAMEELRAALREALAAPGPCDVAADVMAVIAEEEAWAPLGEVFAEALRAEVQPVAVADDVMAALGATLAMVPEDEAAWAPIGAQIAAAVRAEARTVDVWPAVAEVVAAEPAGWTIVSEALRSELGAGAPTVDVADAVMAGIAGRRGTSLPATRSDDAVVDEPPRRASSRFPMWASIGFPVAAVAALAAAAMIAVLVPGTAPVAPKPAPTSTAALAVSPIAVSNDARVEELSTGEAAVAAQVMQFEDGGPTIIFVEEAEL